MLRVLWSVEIEFGWRMHGDGGGSGWSLDHGYAFGLGDLGCSLALGDGWV